MTDRDEAAVAATIDDMYAAFLAGDRERFDSHLAPEVTAWETHLPGPLRTREELDRYRDERDRAGRRPALSGLRAERKHIDVWHDVAAARYELVAEPASGGRAQQFRVTDVLRRTDGDWRIVHHHAELVRSSGAAEDPSAVAAERDT